MRIGIEGSLKELHQRLKGGFMIKRTFLIGLLGISLVVVAGDKAFAKVCTGYIGSYCLVWSGSLECQIGASGIGNVTKDPTYFACSSTSSPGTTWVVGCGNPGTNKLLAPGANTVIIDGGTIEGTIKLDKSQVDKNGLAIATVVAMPDENFLYDLNVNYNVCANQNWTINDAVPCNMVLIDQVLDANNCVTAEAKYTCNLPDCSTLGVDSVTKRFERRQYECTLDSTVTKKCP